jgi:hypothetical protein
MRHDDQSHALLGLFYTAKVEDGLAAGIDRRHPVAHLVGGGHVDKGFQLVVQVTVSTIPMDHPPHNGCNAMQERHAPSRTLVTANETLFQRSRCCSSCRRPDAVRR